MSSKMIKKISLRYQVFAIFSIVFQSFFPLINIFAPVQVLNASSNASQSATVEVVAEVAEAVEVVESEESAEVANDSVEVLSNSVETLPVDVVVDTIDEPLPSVDDDADKPAETPATENPTAQTESESESLQPEKNQAQPATVKTGELYVSHVVANDAYLLTDSLGQEVRLTFTRIDGPAGDLTIKEVQLSEEQQKSVGALSPIAYDITSSMENGSFEYDLRIDLPDGLISGGEDVSEVGLVYAENLASIENSEKVESTRVDSEVLKADGLDHFTIFVVVNPLPGGTDNGDTCTVASVEGACYNTLQAAVNAAAASGDTIELKSDITTTSIVTIAKSLTINGNGFTVSPTFTKVDNSNNAVFGIKGELNTVTMNNLKIEGVAGTNLHGINVYISNATLNDVEIRNNDNTAININGSHVTINNFKSSGNRGNFIFGVIDLDKGSGVTRNPILTVNGQSNHAEDIAIRRLAGSVVDTNGQYDDLYEILYTLKPAPAAPVVSVTTDEDDVTASWSPVSYANNYYYEITGPENRSGTTSNTTIEETDLPNGDYEIKVRSVAKSGLAGNWSSSKSFTISVYNPYIVNIDAYFVKTTYQGIGVDIHVDELIDATKVEVKVERANGVPVVKTNKVTGGVLNTLNTGVGAVVTAPIVIQQGTYDEAGSSSWNQPSETWDSTNVPEKIIVTIERDNGNKPSLVAEVLLAGIGTNLATLEEVMPAPVNNHPDPDGNNQLSLGGTVYRDHKMNDCFGLTSCNDKAEDLGAGWTMNLYQEDDGGAWSLLQSVQTNSSGNFNFSQLTEAGTYHFCEVVKSGWTQQVQNWSGTPYHIATANMSGNAAEGPYCRTVQYDDTSDKSNKAYFGNVDNTAPLIQNLKYFKNDVEVTTPATTPIVVSSIDDLKYSADYADGESGLDIASFTIWEATDSWTAVSGSHKCNWTGSPSTTLLDGSESQSLIDVMLKKCNPGYSWPDGKYLISHRVYDNAGNHGSNPEGRQRFIIDKTAPSVPTNGYPHDIILNSNVFDYTWDPSTDNFGGPITYEYQASQNPAQTGGVLTSGLWQSWVQGNASQHPLTSPMIPSVGTSDGIWHWQVRAIDEVGNKSDWSEIWNYTLDSVAPTTSVIESPANGAFLKSADLNKVDWSNSTDSLPVEYLYQAFSDAGYTSSVYLSSWLGDSEIPALGTPEGTYYVRVKARDAAGNESSWSNGAGNPYLITVDNTPPAKPAWGMILKGHDINFRSEIQCGGLANGTEITLEWNENTETDLDGYWFGTKFDPKQEWVPAGTEAKVTKAEDLVPSDSPYYYTIIAVDKAGNESEISEQCSLTLDMEAPVAPQLVSPANGAVVNGASITQVWSTTDTDIDYFIYESYHDEAATNLRWSENFDGTITSKTATNVGEGTYWWRVKAKDFAGNFSSESALWKITVDNTAPDVAITNLTEDQFVSGKVAIMGTVKDNNLSHYWLDISGPGFSGGPGTVNSASIDDPTTLFSWNTSSLADGEYTIKLEASDKANNKDDGSVHWLKVKVDNTAPTSTIIPPEDAVETNDENTVILNNWDGTISGTSADNLSGVKQVWLSIENDDGKFWDGDSWETGDEASIRIPLVTTGDWSYALSPAPTQGIYTIKSHAEDNAGNLENTAVLIIIYDKTIPEVNLTINPASPDGKRNWYITQPTITLTATDLNDIERIEYQWNSTSGAWTTYAGPINPGQGNNQFYYRAIDKASNASEIGTKTVLFDKEEPSNPETMEVERNGKNPIISWSKANDNTGIHGYKVILTHKTEDISKSISVGSNVREVTFDDLEDGEWEVSIHTEDLAGWSVSRSQKMSIGGAGDVAGVISDIQEGIISPLLRNTVGEVFGATDENNDTNDENSAGGAEQLAQADGMEGQVAGASTECKPWQYYLPIMLLVLQLLALLMVELTLKSSTMSKVVLELLITVGVILLAQYLKNANCFTDGSFLGMLNHWFWLVSVALGAGVRAFSEFLVNED